MARARNIKPGFCRNEDLAECSVWARLCFALLPMLADREGRLEDRAKRIKGDLFPFDTVEVEPLLVELDQRGLIARYSVDGLALIQILAFEKHQHPHHKEPPSTLATHPSLRLDAYGKWVKPEASSPLQPPQALDKPEARPGLDPPRSDLQGGSNPVDSGIDESGKMNPEEDPPASPGPPATKATANGKEPTRPKEPRGSRKCPADFVVTPDLRAEMAAECPGVDIAAETRVFRDHTFRDARSDWPATWRNWIRRAAKNMPASTGPPARRQSATDRNVATLDALTGRNRRTESHDQRPEPPLADVVDVPARLVG